MVHDCDSLGIVDRVHIMVDISDDTEIVRRCAQVTRVVRRRRWSDEEKGRIVAEAIAPGAVIADVARRHDLAPQKLSNWIRVAKDGSGKIVTAKIIRYGRRHWDGLIRFLDDGRIELDTNIVE